MESSSHNLVDHTSMGDKLTAWYTRIHFLSFVLVVFPSGFLCLCSHGRKISCLAFIQQAITILQQPVLFLDGFRNFPVQLIIVVSVKSDSESATAIYELTNWFFNVCCVVLKVVYVRSRKPIYLPLLVRDQGIEICIRLENYHPGNRIVWKPVRSQHLGTQGRMVISDLLEKNNKKKSNN